MIKTIKKILPGLLFNVYVTIISYAFYFTMNKNESLNGANETHNNIYTQ